MIIGIDARELEGKPTGVGAYLRNIVQRISLPSNTRLQLYFKEQIPDVLPDLDAERILLKSRRNNIFWQQWALPRELRKRKVDLFFSPSNTGPWYAGAIQIVTIHDLSFFNYPSWFSAKERLSRQINTAYTIRQASRIYAVSSFVAREISARFGIPLPGILVTSNGVTKKRIDAAGRRMLRDAYGLAEKRIVLYVGLILNRRHVPTLIAAMKHLPEDHMLVIIGKNRTHPPQDLAAIAAQAGMERKVKILEYVGDKVLNDYYQMADAFVYLSEYEGFGIPPLEAMSYHLPVVLSRTPAMNEIFADAAVFVDSISPCETAQAIAAALKADGAEDLRENARKLVEQYSWEKTAEIISQDWERALAAGR